MRISRIRNAILTLALCLLLLGAVRVQATSLSGSGTQEAPYLIKTAADLASVHDDLSAHYALDADIDLFGRIFEPIGNGAEGAFTGSLDGRGHTIRGLELDLRDSKYVGLFGYLEGTVSDLKLSDVEIVGGRYVGAVAGNIGLGGSVTDCSVLSGSVSSWESSVVACVGGITGLCEGTLNRCSNAAAVVSVYYNSRAYIGGLAGSVTETIELSSSSNSGTVSPVNGSLPDSSCGGLFGRTEKKVRMQDCSNTGEVATGGYAGGLIGYAAETAEIRSCSNAGHIESGHYSAGLIAFAAKNVTVEKSTNTGTVIVTTYSSHGGGMIASCSGTATIIDCTNSGAISAVYAGGIAETLSKMELRGCRNEGSISGEIAAAGVAGSGHGNVSSCSNYGNVRSTSAGSSRGAAGILREVNGASVVDGCVNYGSIINNYGTSYSIVFNRNTGGVSVKKRSASRLCRCHRPRERPTPRTLPMA